MEESVVDWSLSFGLYRSNAVCDGKGFSEIDDVIHNTLGCMIGYGIYKGVVCQI